MAKLHNITPYQAPGRHGWNATFTDAAGKRVTRGLGTRDRAEAEMVCRGLSLLVHHQPATPAKAPPSLPPRSLELWFGRKIERELAVDLRHVPDAAAVAEALAPGASPDELRIHIALLEVGRQQLERDLADERRRSADLERQLETLRASSIGRAVESAARCPPMEKALEAYTVHLKASATPAHARDMEHVAELFVKSLPPETKTPAHIDAALVGRFLDDEAAKAGEGLSPALRRDRRRIRVGRFVNWCAKQWGFASPMPNVAGATTQQRERGREAVHYHEVGEVEKAMVALPSDYWRALVATLAFAGLRLGEAAWLRREDLTPVAVPPVVTESLDASGRVCEIRMHQPPPRRQLWVDTVEDGYGGRHEVKVGHSRRAVEVHPTRLWPLLEGHLAATKSELFVFPIPEDTKRRPRKKTAGHPDCWRISALSTALSSRLPPGMGAQSLRRTFGSLLLRDGASIAQVAAAMGNTPDVVTRHYARLTGAEVRVKF